MQNFNLRWVLVLLVGSFLSSCNSIQVNVPVAKLETPETQGKSGQFFGAVGIGKTRDIEITGDASARPPNLTTKLLDTNGEILGKLGVAALENLDFSIRGGIGSTPGMLQTKFQFFGNSLPEAKPNTYSLALLGSVGYGRRSHSGDQNGVFGRGGYRWNGYAQMTSAEVGVIAGYRVSPITLFYAGFIRSAYTMSGNIHDDASDDGQSPEADYGFSATGRSNNLNLGGEFRFSNESNAALRTEIIYSQFEWTGVPIRNDWAWGLTLDFAFR